MSSAENNKLNQLISLSDATEYCCYSQEYLSLLARRGKLKAQKIGRVWHTKLIWLFEYIKQNSSDKKGNYKGEITPKFLDILIEYNILQSSETENSRPIVSASKSYTASTRVNEKKGKDKSIVSENFHVKKTANIKLPSFFTLYKDNLISSIKERWNLVTGRAYKPFSMLENKIILDSLKDEILVENITQNDSNHGYHLSMFGVVYAKLFIWKESLLIRFKILRELYFENKNIFLLPAVVPTAFLLLMFTGFNFSNVNIFQDREMYTPHKINSQIEVSRQYISKQIAEFNEAKIDLKQTLVYLSSIFRIDYKSSRDIAAGRVFRSTALTESKSSESRYVLGASTVDYQILWKKRVSLWISSLSKIINYNHQIAYRMQKRTIYKPKNFAVVKSSIDRENAGQTKKTNITALRRDGVIMIEIPKGITDEEIIYEIANRFSDDVEIDYNKVKNSGIIWPRFRDGSEEGYIYLIIN